MDLQFLSSELKRLEGLACKLEISKSWSVPKNFFSFKDLVMGTTVIFIFF